MAVGGMNVPNDQEYLDVCGNVENWCIAMGGDSHGRNICDAIFSMIGYDRYKEGVRLANPCNFARGGKIAMSYIGDDIFSDLGDVQRLSLSWNSVVMILIWRTAGHGQL